MAHYETLTANQKYYSVARKSRIRAEKWLQDRIGSRKVLDYCCGNGQMAVWMAKHRAGEVHAIDISNISVENGIRRAQEERVNVFFHVMDAEQLGFPDNSFDLVYEAGVLHHLDLPKAYNEIARVLRPGGEAICIEALRHNPFIHLYRKRTPHLRTAWEVEHILGKEDIHLAMSWFQEVEILGWFHLASLAAVPLRDRTAFNATLRAFEVIDDLILRIPGLRWWAWQVIFVLRNPLKA
jgi:ubiquinone/menaquinone biosynthesis C-methylase UbiE